MDYTKEQKEKIYNSDKLKDSDISENGVLDLSNHKSFSLGYDQRFFKVRKAILSEETYVGNRSFGTLLGNIYLEEVEGNIVFVDEEAFYNCVNLRKISPLKVLDIKKRAFKNCALLEEVSVDSQNGIWEEAFMNCEKLKYVNLGKRVKYIDDRAFFNTSIRSVRIPASVVEIGKEAFKDCPNLEEVIFEGDIPSISPDAFDETPYKKKMLYEVSIRENKVYTMDFSFIARPDSNELTLKYFSPDTDDDIKKYINKDGFFEIPSSLYFYKIVGYESNTFIPTNRVKLSDYHDVLLPSQIYNIKNRCFESFELQLGKHTKVIENSCFSGFANLSKIILNDELEVIRNMAFDGCYKLKEIKLPKSIRKIEDNAFFGCNAKIIGLDKAKKNEEEEKDKDSLLYDIL